MRIGIVNDCAMTLEVLRRIVSDMPFHEVAWLAKDGMGAIAKNSEDKPDLILMDLIMPGLDGAETTRRIMQHSPCPILVVTASIESNMAMAFEALSAGAIDVTKVPDGSEGDRTLQKKISDIARVLGKHDYRATSTAQGSPRPDGGRKLLIAIGASTGGPAAVIEVLKALPTDIPAAIVVVVHIDKEFAPGMAEWMNTMVPLPVRLIREGEQPRTGRVLLASTNEHLILTADQTLCYTPEPRHTPYRPSVDTFFFSITQHWHGDAIAVLLTGMGRDGAEGLKAIRNHGWHTIAQDEKSSVVYGMPKAAAGIGAAIEILSLERIGPALISYIEKRRHKLTGTHGGHHVQ